MFYLALGYFAVYLPYAILAKGLSSGIVPGVDAPMTDAAYAILQEAGVIPHRHRSRPLTSELCRDVDAVCCTTAEHRAAVLALASEVAGRTHCLAETDISELCATSLDGHRRTALVIQHAVRRQLAEPFPGEFP